MPRVHDIQPSFSAGELTPRIAARLDFVKYGFGLETCENLIVLAEGGAMRRSGTRYAWELADSSIKGRLKRFQFSTVQSYVLEMGDNILRFGRHQAQITVADTDAAVANGDFASDLNIAFSKVWQVDDTPSGNAYVDETTDANSATDADWDLFPATEAANDYAAFGYTSQFGELVFDYANGTAGVGGTVAWEYWDGSAWTALAGVTDGTTGFTVAAADDLRVTWTVPSDWAAKVINGSASLYWVRAKVTGTYSTNPVMDQGYLRVWVDRSTGGTGNTISYDSTNDRLTLETNGTASDDIGWASQAIYTTNTSQEHVLKFRVVGDPGDKIEFQVGTTPTGADTLAAVEKEVGYHCVAFTPTTSPFYIQFRNLGANADKDVQIDDVSLIDNAPVEIDTPWPEAELFDVEGPQSADVLYLFHDAYPTHKLERYGHTTWSLVEVAWQDGPYLDMNTTATTMTPSATTGVAITVTASAITGINSNTGFQSTDVGRAIRIDNPAASVDWGWGIITAVGSTTSVTVHVKEDFATTDADTRWQLGAWSETTGYPQTATFFEQRLYAAATTDQPQTFWASQTADYENFKPDNGTGTIEDDDALNFTLSADNVNAIRWLSAGEDTLTIGTEGGEWIPTANGIVITPLDITVRRQTTHGSARVQPARIGNTVLFAQRAKRKIREFAFSWEVDNYVARDMTRLAQHITKSGVVEMDYAEEQDSVVWVVRNDGQLLSLTFRRDEDVVGWGRHIIGGNLDDSITKVWQVDADGTIVDETTDAGDTGNADWTLFPSSEAIGDYALFGYTDQFTQLKFDYANGTAGQSGTIIWEYWNGLDWTALAGVTDNTSGFTASLADGLTVTWTLPNNWEQRIFKTGQPLYYVRARITKAYQVNPVLDQGYVSGSSVVESVVTVPGDNGAGQYHDSTNRDEVWMIVKRTINGATKRYVEFLEKDFETGDNQENIYYSDSIITYNGAATTTITGLGHLEGETVKVIAEGAIISDKTVSSASITLDNAATPVQIGLGYKHKLKTLKVSAGNPAGTPLGKTKRIYGLTFALLNSHTLSFGSESNDLTTNDFRVVSNPMDAAVPLYTGEYFAEFPGDWTRDARIVIESDDPVPFTVLAIAPEIAINPLK